MVIDSICYAQFVKEYLSHACEALCHKINDILFFLFTQQYKNGFKWPNPSRSGLLSFEFYDVGVYHFSDHNFQEAAEYMGTIIVKPKQLEHFVEIKADGFSQGNYSKNCVLKSWKENLNEHYNLNIRSNN